MNAPDADIIEIFLQEAAERLQFLREYSGILQDPYPVPEDVERLYVAAHTLGGASAMYDFPLFAEIAGKLAHIFQYAMNASVPPDGAGALVEFIFEAIATLESDLLMINGSRAEAAEEVAAFRQKYPFAFPAAAEPVAAPVASAEPQTAEAAPAPSAPEMPDLPPDGEVPAEVLEFFVPEAEEHLQAVTECLLALEANPHPEVINRLFRAMHTVKGSAAQVGLQRIATVAHRAEDLVGRLRDGVLRPSAAIVDICLESVDTLKKFLYRQWADEATMNAAVKSLLGRIAQLAPAEEEAAEAAPPAAEAAPVLLLADEPLLLEPEAGPVAASAAPAERSAPAAEVAENEIGAHKAPAGTPQSKSVRIALDRLDRMMNAVGELVINRTRMLGRLSELEQLADVLNFSKARMQDKVTEFQEKYEFSRLHFQPNAPEWVPESRQPNFGRRLADRSPFPPAWGAPAEAYPYRGGYSSYSQKFDASLAEFSELEMDRYDDFNILSQYRTAENSGRNCGISPQCQFCSADFCHNRAEL